MKLFRLEQFRHFAIEPRDYLVNGLFPRLFRVALLVNCLEKVSQRFLDNLAKFLGKLIVVVI